MNILIIGSEGFIGSHSVRYFLQKGMQVTGVDLLAEPKSQGYTYLQHQAGSGFNSIFKKVGYDACINASGNGSVPVSFNDPLFDYTANCSEPFLLLEALRTVQPQCKLIHLSSAAVYGSPITLPVKEDSNTQPLSPYGWHKLLSEQLCKEYVALYGLQIAIMRPFSVYGPGLRKQLLWDIFQRSRNEQLISLWGTGNESRDFIYITDVVNAFDLVLQHGEMQGEVYNLASGIETSITDMSKALCELIDPQLQISFNGNVRTGDPLNWKACTDKISSLGFAPQTSLAEGLQQTAAWMKQLNEQ
jgi:UDP-glucose 4-epimerase